MDGEAFLEDVRREFHGLRELAERAVAQIDDESFQRTLGDDGNSIAVVMRHVAGNLRSRWRNFLSTDGEKPDRDREREFELPPGADRVAVLADWKAGWKILFATLDALEPFDLEATITIRGEPHLVPQAMLRQLKHYSYHVGQIVLLARFFAGERWQSLSIPRGASETFREAPRSYLDPTR